MRRYLRHPFWQTLLVLVVAYAVFKFGIAYLPPLLGVRSAPVPGSVVLQYMATVLVAILLYVSADEGRWREFKEPVEVVLTSPERRRLRAFLLVAIPVLVGLLTFQQVRPTVAAPPSLRSIHPAPPSQITFRGQTIVLDGLNNPLRSSGDMNAHLELGKRIYYQNCMACHGDALDSNGHYAAAFSPRPLEFGTSTIAQLTESFVFWRIAKGGPGLPREGAPWNSAMPIWEDFLTEEEIWAVTMFIYQQAGVSPRTWEEH
ncbi:MAG TPA: cytochrome c [Longimicrobiaceae bacterium]|nr:cytochrome c [Longimicrobiaceae bacterium]